MPIPIKCIVCGKIVFKPPSEHKRKYCSAKCYGLTQRIIYKPQCLIPKCLNISHIKGFCNAHYLRFRRYGSPLGKPPKRIYKKGYHRIKPKICKYCGHEFYTSKKSIYCSLKCSGNAHKKSFIIKKGYKKILQPSHPRADKKGYVFEYILILERKLERSLHFKEVTHHIDNNKLNNSPENLTTFANNSIHIHTHHVFRSK